MARKNRTATVAPQPKTPRVPYSTVDRLNFWKYRVTVVDPSSYGRLYEAEHIGRDRAERIAKRKLNAYLRKQSYKNEPTTVYRAKGGAY